MRAQRAMVTADAIRDGLKRRVVAALARANIGISRYSELERLRRDASAARDLALLRTFPREQVHRLLHLLDASRSELRQDLFVLSQLQCKENGYFVEFGASNGVLFSNTYLLEQTFGWTGILCEPATSCHEALHENRTCAIDPRCVWSESGQRIRFAEFDVMGLSTVEGFADGDMNATKRTGGNRYEVETVSLNDLLAEHGAPAHIDYLSVDTEGSEYRILQALDFDRYTFGVITVEHNFTAARPKLRALLGERGYTNVLPELSVVDDWYVRTLQT